MRIGRRASAQTPEPRARLHGGLRGLSRRRRPRPRREPARLRRSRYRTSPIATSRPASPTPIGTRSRTAAAPSRGFDRADARVRRSASSPRRSTAALAHIRTFCADARWPRGELNLPRALFTEKAYPEDEAVITTTLVSEGLDSISHEFLWEQRFGAAEPDRDQVPDHARRSRRAGRLEERHRRPRHRRQAHAAAQPGARRRSCSVGGELVLPTGDEAKGFGKGTTVFESFVLYGKILPSDSFVQLQGIVEFPNDSRVRGRARGARGLRADLDGRRAVRPHLDADDRGARRPRAHGGATTEWDLAPQLQNVVEHAPACPWRRLAFACPSPTATTAPTRARVLSALGLVRRRRAPGLVGRGGPAPRVKARVQLAARKVAARLGCRASDSSATRQWRPV